MFLLCYNRWPVFLLGLSCVVHSVAHADEFDREFSFNIAPESLAAAVLDFAEQSKIQVVTAGADLQQYRTRGLTGRYSVRAALQALLSGTDLAFREVGSGTVSIERSQQPTAAPKPADDSAIALESVLVTAQKRAEPGQSVPISITAISEKTLDLQRVQNLGDVSRLVPGLLISTFSENSPTIRAVITWHPLADALFYTSVTKGFTSGGFNSDASSLRAFAQTFEPETVTNYEVGAKTQWLDDSLRFNASVFDMKYHNKQELVFNSLNGILDIVNAGSATSKGFELTAAYKPLRWLQLSAGYARLVSRYDSFVLGSTNNTGHSLSSSPPNKYSFSMDMECPIGPGYLVGSANYSRIESYNTGAAADPRLQIPSYGLANLNAGYETSDHHYRLTFWSKNVGNTSYILTRSTQVITAEYLGEPRTFGVTFTAKF